MMHSKRERLSAAKGRKARVESNTITAVSSEVAANADGSRPLPQPAPELSPIEEPMPPQSDAAGGRGVVGHSGEASTAISSERKPVWTAAPEPPPATAELDSNQVSQSSSNAAATPELSPVEDPPLPPQSYSDDGRRHGTHFGLRRGGPQNEEGEEGTPSSPARTTDAGGHNQEPFAGNRTAEEGTNTYETIGLDLNALPGAHRMYPAFVDPSVDVDDSESASSEASYKNVSNVVVTATGVPTMHGLEGNPIVGFVPHDPGPDDDVLVDRVRNYLQEHVRAAEVVDADDGGAKVLHGGWFRRNRRILLGMLLVVAAAMVAVPTAIKLSATSTSSGVESKEDTPKDPKGHDDETIVPSSNPTRAPSACPSGHPSDAPSTSSAPSSHPTVSGAPTSEDWSELKAILIGANASRESVFADASSPQSRALRWLDEDDYITSGYDESLLALNSTDRILVRYALAVMYFSTGGAESWRNGYDFVSGDKHECLWQAHYQCEEDLLEGWLDDFGHDCAWYAQGSNCAQYGWAWEVQGYVANEVCCACKTVLMNYDMGVYCDTSGSGDRSVIGIVLDDNNLTGTLPNEEIGIMKDLTGIYMKFNRLEGEIPTALGQLLDLRYFQLYHNQLHGTIPSSVVKLNQLAALGVGRNELTGKVPEWIGNLTSLVQLDLSRNMLNGTISSSIGSLVKLELLQFAENEFSGQIPPSISNMANLRHLYLHLNQLTGKIPFAINELHKLELISLGHNFLTGSIELIEGGSESLKNVGLWDNILTSSIPHQIGTLPSLFVFDTRSNKLNGTIPSELGGVASLDYLAISSNEFTGTLPTSLSDLSLLRWLHVSMNALSGTLPSAIGKMSSLGRFEASSNQLAGSVPPQLGQVLSLLWLDLGDNRFTGSIPPDFGMASSLQHFNISNNLLNGTLPTTFADLVSRDDPWTLDALFIHNNELSGNISFLCENKNENLLIYADCAAPGPEVECICCNICCDREGNCAANR